MVENVYIFNLMALFIVYSFLGWCMEVFYAAFKTGKFINRGFLNGPFCPVYGFGAIGVLHFLSPLKNNLLLLFLLSSLMASFIEFMAGFVLELLFKKKWWDYSNRKFNLFGYICLEFSLIWGGICIFIVKALNPIVLKLLGSLELRFLIVLIIILYIYLFIDLIATARSVLKLNKNLDRVDLMGRKILKLSNKIGLLIAEDSLDLLYSAEKFAKDYEEFANNPDKKEALLKLKALIQERNSFIRAKYLDHKRLFKAFPNLKSKDHNKIIKDLKYLIEHGISYKLWIASKIMPSGS